MLNGFYHIRFMQEKVDPFDGAKKWSKENFPRLQEVSPKVYKSFDETSSLPSHEMTPNEKNLWTANLAKEKLEEYLIGINLNQLCLFFILI